jgi:hypothetical protein
MRRILGLLLFAAIALPAWADEAPNAETPPAHHARETWQRHFTRANAAHDGHLTRQEAEGGYSAVARHFDDVDVDSKGYVTESDIRTWRVMRKAAHRLTKPLVTSAVAPPATR